MRQLLQRKHTIVVEDDQFVVVELYFVANWALTVYPGSPNSPSKFSVCESGPHGSLSSGYSPTLTAKACSDEFQNSIQIPPMDSMTIREVLENLDASLCIWNVGFAFTRFDKHIAEDYYCYSMFTLIGHLRRVNIVSSFLF